MAGAHRSVRSHLAWAGVLLAMAVGWVLWGAHASLAGAPDAVTAEVEPRETTLGRPVTLRVLVPGDAPAVVDTAPLTDFTVIPRGRVVGSRTGPEGKTGLVTAYRFELVPRRAGECRVPPLVVETGGARLATNAVTVVVQPGPAVPPGLAGKTLYLDASLSRPAVYRGQSLIYSLRLFRAVAASSISVTPPAFDGFDAAALPGQADDEIEAGGRRYAVSQVEYVLTPLRTGRLPLAPATARLTDVAGTAGPVGLTGPALAVETRPLPPAPDGMVASGLVGRMELDAALSPELTPVGQEAILTVTLSGTGNLAEAAIPTPVAPGGISLRRLPEPTGQDAAIKPGPHGFSGRRTARFAVTADRPGRFVLPGARLAVFDPDLEAWHAIAAPDVALTATAAANQTAALIPALTTPENSDPALVAARAAYKEGRFAEAATAMEAALGHDKRPAETDACLDTATAWRMAGDPGRAALWLYRAELADPGDARVARAQAAADLPRLAPGLLLGNHLPRGMVSALAGLAAACLGLASLIACRFFVCLPRGVWLLAGAFALWLVLEAGWLALTPVLAPRAVVTATTPARCAPEATAETLFEVKPGAIVRLGPKRDGFVRIDAGHDALGWVARDTTVTPLP